MSSFGTLNYREGKWHLDCRPHVAMKAKRVFGGVRAKHVGPIIISDTTDNARDIQWFLERYPLVIESGADILKRRGEQFRERAALVDELLSRRGGILDFKLAKPPREYQKEAASLLLASGGLLLGDDVGLGKTASGICTLIDPRTRPALVVTLTHLTRQWRDEIRKFAPELKTHIINSGRPYDLTRIKQGRFVIQTEFPDVVIMNYHKLPEWAETLGHIMNSVIFDEVQELRRHGEPNKPSHKYAAAKYIADCMAYRMGLSATPFYNYGGEMYNVIECIAPGALGTREEFAVEWCAGWGGEKAKIEDPAAFGTYLRERGLLLRRTRKDVGRELPPLQKITHYVETDESALKAVSKNCRELATLILHGAESHKGQKMRASEELSNRLRQATGIAKCLAPGTKVIKHDGSVVAVENIKVGDALMGPDGLPRFVTATTSGQGEMYRVSSTSRVPLFEPYCVNGDHILALKHSGEIRHGDRFLFKPYLKGDHIEIPVSEYLGKSRHFKRLLKGYKTGVQFPEIQTSLDPYFMGLWLGDGSSDSSAITTEDREVLDYIYRTAESYGLFVTVKNPDRTAPTYRISPKVRGGNISSKHRGYLVRNPITDQLRKLGVFRNKHIPQSFLINSRERRMRLLAGLIDSDGHLNCPGVYTITSKWRHLAEQICWLCASLGLASKLKETTARNQLGNEFPAYRVTISGNGLESLPLLVEHKKSPPRRQIKDPLRSGIKVESVGHGPYHGFSLTGDGLFLLGDFTVTHNSPYVAEFVRLLVESGEKVVLFGWHHGVYAMWMELLKDLSPVMYTGHESESAKELSKKQFVEGDAKVMIISLRSGAGLDGLQKACRTVVFGELDWSPGVITQCIGRVQRDGQPDPVAAYFLVAEDGADPTMTEVLGLKGAQIEGINNPDAEMVEKLEVDPDHIKKLAKSYLQRTGGVA